MALNRRNRVKSGFLDKALGHLGRFDPSGLQSVVQRLAKEREFLESLFNTIDSGIIVTDDQGRMVYFNLMATRMLASRRRPPRRNRSRVTCPIWTGPTSPPSTEPVATGCFGPSSRWNTPGIG